MLAAVPLIPRGVGSGADTNQLCLLRISHCGCHGFRGTILERCQLHGSNVTKVGRQQGSQHQIINFEEVIIYFGLVCPYVHK